jgi:hypothetical protein
MPHMCQSTNNLNQSIKLLPTHTVLNSVLNIYIQWCIYVEQFNQNLY